MNGSQRTQGKDKRGNVYDRRARREFLMKKFGNGRTIPCYWCGKRMRTKFEVDRYPICGHAGGTYVRENLVASCKKCNASRCTKYCRGSATKPRSVQGRLL